MVFMQEDSGFIQKWLSVIPIGLGNAVIFVTVLSMKFFRDVFHVAYPWSLFYAFLRLVALQAHVQGTFADTRL